MNIDLSSKLADHFKRLEDLADEAVEDDSGESYSSRASAMSALTQIIKDLIINQEKVYNMKNLQELQSSIVEALEEKDQAFKNDVLMILERRLQSL